MPDHDYRNVIKVLARRKSATVTVFADFCRMAACCLAMGSREEEYLAVAKNYTRDELNDISQALAMLLQEMETHPFVDLLGPFYLECASHSSKQARGEFFTPPEVSKLMALMLFDVKATKAKGKPVSVNEPACGSGGIVLSLAELFAPDGVDLLRVTAQDINPVATDMTYINLTLWGIPARVILGDTMRGTVTREWCNLHWFRVGEPDRLKFEALREFVTSTEKPQTGETNGHSSVVDLGQFRGSVEAKGQFLFDL